MNLLPVTPESLKKAVKIINSGGLAAFPTETVYGLGANAYDPNAVAKIFEVKKRPKFDPLIVHIASIETLEKVANLSLLDEETHKKLFLLAENFWPGPLSIILPKNKKIPGIVTAGLPTVAVRFPDHKTALHLISESSGAVAAPSANPFGSLSPTRAEHVRDSLGGSVDIILDGGPTQIGLESTVIDITGGCIKILRPGGTPKEAIENIAGKIKENELKLNDVFTSPGQLKSHYAPKTRLFALTKEEIIQKPYEKGYAFMFYDGLTRDAWLTAGGKAANEDKMIRTLSEAGGLLEAAAGFFQILHELESLNIAGIFAQLAPQQGLGEAINDRLRRGAA